MTIPTSDRWQSQAKIEEKQKYVGPDLTNLVTEYGSVKVNKSDKSEDFANNFGAFLETYKKEHQEAITCCKDIKLKSHDLAESVASLAKAFSAFSELQKVIKESEYSEIFSMVGSVMRQTQQHFEEQGELIKLYCGSHMKYHLAESESLAETSSFRESVKSNFVKREKQLNDKKLKLLKEPDVSKWHCSNDRFGYLLRNKDEICADP